VSTSSLPLTRDNLKKLHGSASHSQLSDLDDDDNLGRSTSSIGRARSLSVASETSTEGERPTNDEELLAAVDELYFVAQDDAKVTRHTLMKLAALGPKADVAALVVEQQKVRASREEPTFFFLFFVLFVSLPLPHISLPLAPTQHLSPR
jgi:hypothetical protein